LLFAELNRVEGEQVDFDQSPKLRVAPVEALGQWSLAALGDVGQNVSFLKNLRDSFVLFFYSTKVVGFLLLKFSLKTRFRS